MIISSYTEKKDYVVFAENNNDFYVSNGKERLTTKDKEKAISKYDELHDEIIKQNSKD